MNPAEAGARLTAERNAFLGFLQRRVGDPDLAEDLLQDAFARALERVDAVRDDEALVAWFYRVLRNAVIDHARRDQAETRRLDHYAQRLSAATEPDDPHFEQLCSCVTAVVDALKPEYAEVLRRVDLEGSPLSAFAGSAGITANNAGVRLHRARKALRRGLLSFCQTCAEHGCLDCSCRRPANDDDAPAP